MTLVRRLSLAGIAILLLALSAAPVQAQSTWKDTFGTQMAELLRSPHQSLQNHAMYTLTVVANREDDLQLQAAANPLLDIYAAASEPDRRRNAVVALSKIDDPVSYTTLLVMAMDEPSEMVREAILDAAAESHSIQHPTVARAYNRLLRQTVDSETHS